MLIYLQMIPDDAGKKTFQQVYKQYRGLMYHVAYQMLNNTQDAEDAVHEAFAAIAKQIEKISQPVCTKTRSYVVIIVESKAIDMLRRRSRPTAELDENMQGVEMALEEGTALSAAMARLPGRYRELLLLKYAYGYTNQECADLFETSYENIHRLDQRAKAKLRQFLEEEGITP